MHRVVLCLLVLSGRSWAQLSKPIVSDRQIDTTDNKFLQRQASEDDFTSTANDEVKLEGECSANLVLKWMTEVGSSIYATPLIHDLYSDGQKDIIVPSFVHYLEVVDGSNGAKARGDAWPAFHKSTVHASPLLYDFDFDNVQDIVLATFDGEILFFKDTGEMHHSRLVVPRLKVHKDWWQGLAEDFIAHDNPDVGGKTDAEVAAVLAQQAQEASTTNKGRSLQSTTEESSAADRLDGTAIGNGRSLLGNGDSAQQLGVQNAGELSDEAAATFSELFGEGIDGAQGIAKHTHSAEEMAGVEDLKWDDMPLNLDGGIDSHERYASYYGDYQIEPGLRDMHDHAWNDERYFASPHKGDRKFVSIDSHILCTPLIADIDADGRDEIVIAATYFFDREYYDKPENSAELGKDIDTTKYIAGAIVVFDLHMRQMKWTQHLDLSTDVTSYRAYIYSAPVLADLDNDGKLEIIVGTSMGFLYVLNHKGETREGWPIQMGDIQAGAAVTELYGDGRLIIIAADSRGSVAAFDADGKELWERHLGSLVSQAPTFADVNGDGYLEVLTSCVSGAVYVMDRNGRDIPNFPFYTKGKVMSQILPTRLRPGSSLQLVVPSFDGHLYVIDGITGCADVVDIGETSYAMVLADDLNGNGQLDLLFATMNGNLYAFQSTAAADPDSTWPAQVNGLSGFTSKLSSFSVAGTADARQPRDVRGRSLNVRFEIKDPAFESGNLSSGPYNTVIALRGVGKKEMRSGEQPVVGATKSFDRPGIYSLELPCPKARSTATVHIEVRNRLGQVVIDEFSLSFHMHFHRLLKWLLSVPIIAASLAVLAQQAGNTGLSLPSFQ